MWALGRRAPRNGDIGGGDPLSLRQVQPSRPHQPQLGKMPRPGPRNAAQKNPTGTLGFWKSDPKTSARTGPLHKKALLSQSRKPLILNNILFNAASEEGIHSHKTGQILPAGLSSPSI
jgi:hypothetical protein